MITSIVGYVKIRHCPHERRLGVSRSSLIAALIAAITSYELGPHRYRTQNQGRGGGTPHASSLPRDATQQCNIFWREPKAEQPRIVGFQKPREDARFDRIVARPEKPADERGPWNWSSQGYRSHALTRELNAHDYWPFLFVRRQIR
jgi:hypothetical protein